MDSDNDQEKASAKKSQWHVVIGENSNDQPEKSDKSKKSHADSVEWSASEYINHEKSPVWYVLLFIFTTIFAAIIYLLTKDKITTGAIVVAAIMLGIFAALRPRTLQYRVDKSGITINTKHFSYTLFRSFSIMEEGAFISIFLTPLKRFMPGLSLYIDPKDEDKIIEVFSEYLPIDNKQHDVIDRFMHKIKF